MERGVSRHNADAWGVSLHLFVAIIVHNSSLLLSASTNAASETAVGTSDDALLKVATAEQRLLITFDRDFGELATRRGQAAPGGILLLRFVPRNAEEVSALIVGLLARSGIEWAQPLTVLDRTHLR